MKLKRQSESKATSIIEREDLFLSTVNRHADRCRAAAASAATIQAVKTKTMRDTAFGFLGILALAVSVAYGLAQIL